MQNMSGFKGVKERSPLLPARNNLSLDESVRSAGMYSDRECRAFEPEACLLESVESNAAHTDLVKHVEKLLIEDRKVGVLVIDMQSEFEKDYPDDIAEQVFRNQIAFIKAVAKKPQLSVFDINYQGYGRTLPAHRQAIESCREKNRLIKNCDDAFYRECLIEEEMIKVGGDGRVFLEEMLRARGIHDLILFGAFDVFCVKRTADGALQKGFTVATDYRLNIPQRKRDMYLHPSKEALYSFVASCWQDLRYKYRTLTITGPEYEPCSVNTKQWIIAKGTAYALASAIGTLSCSICIKMVRSLRRSREKID